MDLATASTSPALSLPACLSVCLSVSLLSTHPPVPCSVLALTSHRHPPLFSKPPASLPQPYPSPLRPMSCLPFLYPFLFSLLTLPQSSPSCCPHFCHHKEPLPNPCFARSKTTNARSVPRPALQSHLPIPQPPWPLGPNVPLSPPHGNFFGSSGLFKASPVLPFFPSPYEPLIPDPALLCTSGTWSCCCVVLLASRSRYLTPCASMRQTPRSVHPRAPCVLLFVRLFTTLSLCPFCSTSSDLQRYFRPPGPSPRYVVPADVCLRCPPETQFQFQTRDPFNIDQYRAALLALQIIYRKKLKNA